MLETPFDGTDEQWDEGWERPARQRARAGEPDPRGRPLLRRARRRDGDRFVELGGRAGLRDPAAHRLRRLEGRDPEPRTDFARNHARDGVLAYVVAPGIVRTPLSEISATYRGGIDAVNAALAMGAMVEPIEVARTIAFLASGEVPNLTGATLDVNGASHIR